MVTNPQSLGYACSNAPTLSPGITSGVVEPAALKRQSNGWPVTGNKSVIQCCLIKAATPAGWLAPMELFC